MTDNITNCPFKFQCDKTWDGLNPTENRRVRHCNQCQKDVHLVTTERQLSKAISNDLCVAVDLIDTGAAVGYVGIGKEPKVKPVHRLLGLPAFIETPSDES